jgi:hypothetical protein
MLFQNLKRDYIEWLASHGANLFRTMPASSNLRLSCLIAEWMSVAHLDNILDRILSSPKVTKGQRLKSLESAFVSKNARLKGWLYGSSRLDGCVCRCSPRGCRPVTSALKPFSLSRDRLRCTGSVAEISEQPERLTFHMVKCLYTDPAYQEVWEGQDWLPEATIRFLTFEELGIVHVCCRYSPADKEWHIHKNEEVTELLEEEAYKIRQLEDLVNEFQAKYVELRMLLPEFLEFYWTKRMEEFLRNDMPLSKQELSRIREIGVILHS